MSVSISLCMIVKNEEERLGACLESVKEIADEINIVDTGSTDTTVEIAKKYTDRIFHFEWVNDFSKARNFSFSKATKDYIMWLDADDTITPENKEKILKLKEKLKPDIKYVNMLYHYRHFDDGTVSTILDRSRLVKRSENFEWMFPIHEILNVTGKNLETDIFITHNMINSDIENSFSRNYEIIKNQVDNGDNSIRTVAYYAGFLFSMGKMDEALMQMERLLSMPEKYMDVLSSMGIIINTHVIYLKKGNETAALMVLLDNERFMRDKSEYYCYLGAYYINHDDVGKALKCFERALTCEGREITGSIVRKKTEFYYFEPLRAIAHCYAKLGQLDTAMEYCEKAIECVPHTVEALLNTYLTAHEIYFKKGDYESALKVLLDNERQIGNKSEYYCALGAIYNFLQNTQMALESFHKALDCKASNNASGDFLKEHKDYYYFEPLRSIGNCYIKLKRYEEALTYFKKALENKPDDETTIVLVNKLERAVELAKSQ